MEFEKKNKGGEGVCSFLEISKVGRRKDERADGRTDGQTDGRTDGRTDGKR